MVNFYSLLFGAVACMYDCMKNVKRIFIYTLSYRYKILLFQMFFEDNIDDAKYCGHLYGLGPSYVMNGNATLEEASPIPTTSTS